MAHKWNTLVNGKQVEEENTSSLTFAPYFGLSFTMIYKRSNIQPFKLLASNDLPFSISSRLSSGDGRAETSANIKIKINRLHNISKSKL